MGFVVKPLAITGFNMNDSERSGIIKATIESALVELNVSIPAVVVDVEGGDFVTVRPDIPKTRMMKDGSKQYEATTDIENVKVLNTSCGGFGIRLPLKSGCKGFLVFSDYDLDNWKDGNTANVNTDRYHDQNDCFFFPAFNEGSRNDGDCLELYSDNVTLKICDDGFDVEFNGDSLIDEINKGFIKCGCPPPLIGWKP